ncbi:Uncharacterized protein TCM_009109 [Theobroma cacao]|uniref:Uncharacterized protein n=1 Tax=Theobroma cacao TaxID=3641 RepID=A0A061E4L0_THECC|nr:Uncharacterized protein TCM_009109 [Theobroma cacao]
MQMHVVINKQHSDKKGVHMTVPVVCGVGKHMPMIYAMCGVGEHMMMIYAVCGVGVHMTVMVRCGVIVHLMMIL